MNFLYVTWLSKIVFIFNFVTFFSETGSCCAVQASLKVMIFPPQSPKPWDYKHELPKPMTALNFQPYSKSPH